MEEKTPISDNLTPQNKRREAFASLISDMFDENECRETIKTRLNTLLTEIKSFRDLIEGRPSDCASDPDAGPDKAPPGFLDYQKLYLEKTLKPRRSKRARVITRRTGPITFTPRHSEKEANGKDDRPEAPEARPVSDKVVLNTVPGSEASVHLHRYSDRTPLCASPIDPSLPAYIPLTVENIWTAFELTPEIAAKIKREMSDFLYMNADARVRYFDDYSLVRKIKYEDCAHDACDTALIGQNGLFAKKPLPIWTTLGVYAGVFLRNQKELDYLAAIDGKKNISDYMFRICQYRGWPKLSAFRHGSRLSAVNSASNYGDGLAAGLETVKKRMNAAVFYARTQECPFPEIRESPDSPDLVFFVTCRDVAAGEQFLTDYGPVYWAND